MLTTPHDDPAAALALEGLRAVARRDPAAARAALPKVSALAATAAERRDALSRRIGFGEAAGLADAAALATGATLLVRQLRAIAKQVAP